MITTVTLRFQPSSGSPLVASFRDLDGDGGAPPEVDSIALVPGTSYDLGIEILNELENPPEDVTLEIAEEDDEHQVFFTGTGVESPATGPNLSALIVQAYSDLDGDGSPLGLLSTIDVVSPGSAVFRVTQQHMPPVNGTSVKTGTLADLVASSGLESLPGEPDFSIEFALTVE